MDSVQYRRLQEQSVKGYSGGNELEIIFTVCWPILYALARNLFPKCFGGKRSFIFEFVTLILPIILLFTWPSVMYAVVPIVVSILAVNVAAGLLNGRNKSGYSTLVDEASQKNPIDNCRASIMTMVTLAILAVDFNVFPRRFAKTETFGFSLMDFGVGLVVFSFAFTSGRNLIKNPKMIQKKSIQGLLIDTFKANFLLFALGFARFLMVRRTDYYVNAGEYGVHWNFFITLWVISILLKLSNHFLKVSLHLAGVLVAVFYQMMLSLTPLQNYILYSDRVPTSFLSLNREGIWSLAGYFSLGLLSLDVGMRYFRVSSANQRLRFIKEISMNLVCFSGIFLILKHLFKMEVSRKMANLQYVIIVYCVALLNLLSFLVIESTLIFGNRNVRSGASNLVEAISRNQLTMFIIGNLLTGLINMTIQTLLISDIFAIIILVAYMFILCKILVFLHNRNITIRMKL